MTSLKTRLIHRLNLHTAFGYQAIDDFQEQDVFIVGYPKSGNSWMQHLMTGIVYDASMSEISNRLVRELTPDVHLYPFYKRFMERMYFKSHHLPLAEYRTVIYIVRDGRDAVTSYYHMLHGQGNKVKMDAVVKEGKHLFPSKWHEHVGQWLANPFDAKIHYVRYEDLKSGPLNELRKIAEFLELDRSDDRLKTIIENCSFGSMRKKEESVLWDKNKKWEEGKFFVRKGETGDYVNHMSPELIEYFNREAGEALSRFGYNTNHGPSA